MRETGMESAAKKPLTSSVLAPLRDKCELALAEHGPTHRGVLYPREEDVRKRFTVAAGLWESAESHFKGSVLDLGCGYGALLDYLTARNAAGIEYRGVDISSKMIEAAKERHPDAHFEVRDILADPLPERCADYVVVSGVLTAKFDVPQADMAEFAIQFLAASFRLCRKGMAFNVQNWYVPRRPDLFHWPFDEAAAFIHKHCSSHYTFRMDYGLYDYTAYVYREPVVK